MTETEFMPTQETIELVERLKKWNKEDAELCRDYCEEVAAAGNLLLTLYGEPKRIIDAELSGGVFVAAKDENGTDYIVCLTEKAAGKQPQASFAYRQEMKDAQKNGLNGNLIGVDAPNIIINKWIKPAAKMGKSKKGK